MIVGIDLGTTNSAIACFRDGAPQLIPNALGDLLTPSAVSLGKDGALLVGLAARERQSTHPEATATAFKRHMGTRKRYTLGRRAYSAEDLSALVLASLKADAERFTGEKVTGAVITVPAYFNDQQRKATRRAGELAGLKVERLVNEPTAAALAYGIHERGDREPFLVFDLGGGTFDVSIVEVFDGVIEVRASAGDNRLGGEDFNDVMARIARAAIDPEEKLAARGKESLFHEVLRAAAERSRRALSEAEEASFEIVWEGQAYGHRISAAAFDEAVEPLLQRMRDPVLRSLRDSNIAVGGLSDVVMVGGATRMPAVRRAVTRMFGRFPNHSLHPDHAVALGAAVQAGLKARDAALDEIRLTDVCPFTLGIDTAMRDPAGRMVSGVFAPIIERNTVVPASRMHRFQTMIDQQKQVEINIFQGEARDVSENVHLGQVQVPVPPRPAGEVAVDVRFSYDASGLLEVDVNVPMSGLARQVVISSGDGGDSPEEIEARRAALAELKVHPRDEAVNAATLARAERCYENFLGDRRQHIGEMILAFEAVLERQEPHAIDDLRQQVEAALDLLEGERFL
ncbi:molecular chaperone HscC [Sphingomonas kyeonggiensis]|uniref:Hsp70 family protein n=1 Tax=Sphingomonas kyeonggiensis TaxID=1268553 RepID=UPI00278B0C78|nr:molecular chaperone HscC [Sphingomonas kyeonggiensis]MDQ0248427.1 molecular chaperone HscC [Sphingomonas kyeonggiensis]